MKKPLQYWEVNSQPLISNSALLPTELPWQCFDGLMRDNHIASFSLVDLLGLLKWRANPATVPTHLENLTKVDGEEVVKFLQDTLDVLFDILLHNTANDPCDYKVFDALVCLCDEFLSYSKVPHHLQELDSVQMLIQGMLTFNFCANCKPRPNSKLKEFLARREGFNFRVSHSTMISISFTRTYALCLVSGQLLYVMSPWQ